MHWEVDDQRAHPLEDGKRVRFCAGCWWRLGGGVRDWKTY